MCIISNVIGINKEAQILLAYCFLLLYAVYVDYKVVQWDIYVQYGRPLCSGAMPIMTNVCIPVILATMLIALNSYEVFIVT